MDFVQFLDQSDVSLARLFNLNGKPRCLLLSSLFLLPRVMSTNRRDDGKSQAGRPVGYRRRSQHNLKDDKAG